MSAVEVDPPLGRRVQIGGVVRWIGPRPTDDPDEPIHRLTDDLVWNTLEERMALVGRLTEEGLSAREIGGRIGASLATVQGDRQRIRKRGSDA